MRISVYLFSTASVLSAIVLAAPAAAQTVTLNDPPVRLPLDEQGVDLATGSFVAPSTSLSIGDDASGLVHTRFRVGNGWRHNYLMAVKKDTSGATVMIGGRSHTFMLSGGVYASNQGDGSTLTEDPSKFVFTDADGTVYEFSKSLNGRTSHSYYGFVSALATSITEPNGKKITLTYRSDSYEKPVGAGGTTIVNIDVIRLQSVNSSTGYQLKYSYALDTPYDGAADDWYRVTRVTAINNAVEYCNPAALGCSLTQSWPYLAYAESNSGTDRLETVTDPASRTTRFRTDSSRRLRGIKRPGESSDGTVIAYDGNSRVSTVTRQGSYTRSYSWSAGSGTLTAVSTDSLGRTRTTTADTSKRVILTDRNALNQVTTYVADTKGRITSISAPEGNKILIEYDPRGNIKKSTRRNKSGVTTDDIVTSAEYPATCSNQKTCNKPTSTTDERGFVTEYQWNPTHGALDWVKLPSPDGTSIRPETRVTYAGKYARYLSGPSTWATSAAPIYKATSISTCRLGIAPACVGTADERVTMIAFPASSVANNAQASSVTRKAGNNTLIATTSLAYDNYGQLSTIDGPLSGTDDKVQIRYDSVGQVVGRVGADPDGTGSKPRIAERLAYNADGQVTSTETGTVANLTDTAWSAFSPVQKSVTTYDPFGRVKTQAQVATSGTAQYSLTQYSYDAAGRQQCVTQRMNAPLTTTVLPDACTLLTPSGAHGDDRIRKWEYNAVDQVTKIHSGVGTALAQVTLAAGYDTASNKNGQLLWAEDANGNRTGYVYDGFDRNVRVNYPSKTAVHTPNTGDYEQYGFDKAGNVISFRTRRDETLTMTYDNLNRLVTKIVPGSTAHTRDVYFEYDLFGNMTKARFDSITGAGSTFAYDALGRRTSETTSLGQGSRTVSHQYDVSGNRTQIVHPDGQAFIYQYDNASRPTEIMRASDSLALIGLVYDTQGRMSGLTRYSTAPDQTFGYDAASRLYQLNVINGGSNNAQWNFAFNPAGQVISETRNNDLYAWGGHVDVGRDYSANGLNQYTSVAGVTYGYDLNGNLTSDGANSYVYDAENRLVSANFGGTANLYYDPLGRLYRVDKGGGQTWFLYDGTDLIGEFNASGTMLNRYVHGVGAGDDPLIAYEGASLSEANQHFLYGDRLGSIVLSAKRDGTDVRRLAYDEYGIVEGTGVGAGGQGRFAYTGQVWLPEIGMYYYKARMYSSSLGRFMQTDPIGYADGMNMYAYVRNDPINGLDPTGTIRKVCKKVTVTVGDGPAPAPTEVCWWEAEPRDWEFARGPRTDPRLECVRDRLSCANDPFGDFRDWVVDPMVDGAQGLVSVAEYEADKAMAYAANCWEHRSDVSRGDAVKGALKGAVKSGGFALLTSGGSFVSGILGAVRGSLSGALSGSVVKACQAGNEAN